MSATESDSTERVSGKDERSGQEMFAIGAVEVRILLPEAWIGLIGRASIPRRPMSI